jgi:hypothetical protein
MHKIIIPGISWTVLGVYRGLKEYDYDYNKSKNKKTYLYSSRFWYGIVGAFVYINPVFSFITIPREIYRLEVVIRGLEDEKHTDKYNNVW